MKRVYRIIATLLSVVLALSCFACSGLFSAVAEDEYVSAQLPGFESLSAVQIALVWRENFLRMRSTNSVHPESSAKSLELTLASPADGEEYENFSFASVTAADKAIDGFYDNAHELPRGGDIFGGASIGEAEKISVWLGEYPATGKVVMRLMTAPSRGPQTENYPDYPLGFVFRSAEITPVDGVATFDISSFYPDNDWTSGSIYDNLDQVNALTLTFIPGEGNAAYNTKFYVSDLRIWKKAADYSWTADAGAASGVFEFTVRSADENADISVTVEGEPLTQVGDTYKNSFGETCFDYSIDTTAYPDGIRAFKAFDGDECVLSAGVIFDNVEPFMNSIADSEANYGVIATEGGGEIKLSAYADPGAVYTFYKANVLPVTATQNFSTLNDMKQRDPQGETAIDLKSGAVLSTVSQTTSVPYQAFEIDATGKTDTIYLTYRGSTIKNETLILEVFDPVSATWYTLARGDKSGAENEFTCAVDPAEYADANGKIKVRVSEYLYGNGSDSFAWTTDTQYYISNSSYRHYMEEQFDWFVSEYNDGNIAYVCNTCDVVDNKTSDSQYQLARTIHNKLDNANVPNGVTPGNHDIGNAHDETLYYDKWETYFGAKYYDYQPWWGGGYLGNTSHYDLVTVGGRDFIFLYLGLNHETTDEGAAWANKVLKMYPHRTAVILTHQFLSTSGALMTGSYGFADQILEKIVEPNPNVRVVLCGHEPAAHNLYRKMNNGVTIVELLHNYQFDYKQYEDGTWATTWSTKDGGKGYFRYMVVGDGTITSRCYSASYPDIDHYYQPETGLNENYTMSLEYVQSNRRINTSYFSATCGVESLGDYTVNDKGDVWTLSFTGPADGSAGWYVVAERNGRYVRSQVYPIIEKPFAETIKGDLDGDGVITVSDALAALRIAAKLADETDQALATGDMDSDGSITVADALRILRISVGLL